LKEKVDTGNMILQEKIIIEPEDNFETLHDKMKVIGAEVLLNTISLVEKDEVNEKKQDDSLASPAPKITKEICKINWSNSAVEIHNLVRGLSPYPGALLRMINSIKSINPRQLINPNFHLPKFMKTKRRCS
jgi:methionyl-tRNA formyltransferase